MNFFVNQAMGFGNSGVEHAEFYRAERFKQAKLPYRYVFLGLVTELHEAMDKWGLSDNEVLNMWEYFVLGGDYLRKGLTKRRERRDGSISIDKTKTSRKQDMYTSSGLHIVKHLVKQESINQNKNNTLIVRASHTEMFDLEGQRRVLFENVLDRHMGETIRNIHLYNESGHHMFFGNLVTLYQYFFKKLDANFVEKNNFIIDRGENVDEALMFNKDRARNLLYVIHADHLSDRNDPKRPLWNNHYEYLLDNMDKIDRVIVATELQRQDLIRDFPRYANKIKTIPVGGVSEQHSSRRGKRLGETVKIITASRLAKEKHLDIAIKAIVGFHDLGHKVEFDIYGQGGEMIALGDLIKKYKATDYIRLMGLSNHLETVYPKYDAFLSTSFSEGFGLTYIEALNASLPVITFNARFGAMELIKDGTNGFLLDFKRNDDAYNVKNIVQGLNKLVNCDYEKIRKNTRFRMSRFSDRTIAREWSDLINEL